MDISDIASVATATSRANLMNEVQFAVLKRAMQAATEVAPSNPPNLGNQMELTASSSGGIAAEVPAVVFISAAAILCRAQVAACAAWRVGSV